MDSKENKRVEAKGAPSSVGIPYERIEQMIIFIRNHKVMLDADLATLYGVETRVLVQAVKRNRERFPPHFMFQLSEREFQDLRSQSVISSGWGGRRYPPYAFTEHGVAMLSSVLRSKKAIQANIAIIDTFIRLRNFLATHENLARKLVELENKYDSQFRLVFEALRGIMAPGEEDGDEDYPRIGFGAGHE